MFCYKFSYFLIVFQNNTLEFEVPIICLVLYPHQDRAATIDNLLQMQGANEASGHHIFSTVQGQVLYLHYTPNQAFQQLRKGRSLRIRNSPLYQR